jgi:CRISPR/Cas system-associated exonuclease Cas4 (RecB family)
MTDTRRMIKISPSGLNSIQSCFRYSYFNRVLGYQDPNDNQNEALVKGLLIHEVLEVYYNNILASKPPLDNIRECIILAKEKLSGLNWDDETKNHTITILVEYFGFYQNDAYKPVAVESPFSYELYEDENVRILLEGKIDLIAERMQENDPVRYVFDHKSRGRDTTPVLLQNQYMAYALATGINNVVDNQIGTQKTLKPADKFKRRVLSYSEEQLEEFAEWSIFWVLSFDAAVQQNHFPPRFTSCGNCDFLQVCTSDKDFRMEKLERFFVKRDKDYDIFGEAK